MKTYQAGRRTRIAVMLRQSREPLMLMLQYHNLACREHSLGMGRWTSTFSELSNRDHRNRGRSGPCCQDLRLHLIGPSGGSGVTPNCLCSGLPRLPPSPEGGDPPLCPSTHSAYQPMRDPANQVREMEWTGPVHGPSGPVLPNLHQAGSGARLRGVRQS
jgi:hypothetical protein